MLSRSLETPADSAARPALRARLLAERSLFAAHPRFGEAASALGHHLLALLHRLEPACIGLYWPVRGEFNAPAAVLADRALARLPKALPFARRQCHEMHYRCWDGSPPSAVDECGIAACEGSPVVPDVVLVPCVGFTAGGLRLGYGGGYFDRWIAAHPQVVAVGIAWSFGRIDEAQFAAEPHDRALGLVVTEQGAV